MLVVVLRRLAFPPGTLALYLLLAAARIAYWPTQVVSPRAAQAMTTGVERWIASFARWCQPAAQ